MRAPRRLELAPPEARRRILIEEIGDERRGMTRRTFLLRSMIIAGFGAVLAKLGKMQLLDAARYQRRAAGNIIRFEALPAPRGLIVDRNGVILAQNRRAWSVSIVPDQLPDDPQQRAAVRDQLIRMLNLDTVLVVRPAAVPPEARRPVADALSTALNVPLGDVLGPLVSPPKDGPFVLLREQLSPAEVATFQSLAQQWPGVHVLNRYDYLLEQYAGSGSPIVLKRDVPRDLALQIGANPLSFPGVVVDDNTLMRQYPAGPIFAHVLGYVGPITKEEYDAAGGDTAANPYLPNAVVGRDGIEQALEPYLRGTRGGRWLQTDARGAVVSELVDRRQDPVPGYTVVLTIDSALQKAAAEALQAGIAQSNDAAAKQGRSAVGSGVAIALDPRSGEVLALVSLPTYDNQRFADGISQAEYQRYLNDPFRPLFNYAVRGEFPPGSTVKPLLACAALQEGTITAQTTFTCRGAIRVPTEWDENGGNYYYCWLRSGHGPITVLDGIAQSCNVFFYNVGAPNQQAEGANTPLHYYIPGDPQPHFFSGLGIERIGKYLREQFGFGQPTGIELGNEASGLVPDPRWLFQELREYWSVGDTINVSIGQGHLSCTPLQLACALAAIANGGTYYRPRLVRELRDANGETVRTFEPVVVRKLGIAPEHIQLVRQAMRRTVTDGTAKGKFVRTGDTIPIAGKTGTAEYGQSENGKYTKQHAWFTAFAPYDAPEILVLVLIRDGGEGATFAVPVADAILAAYFHRTTAGR